MSDQKSPIENNLERTKNIVEAITALVGVGAAIVSFINNIGGPIQFLVEVAFFGFACYVSFFVILPVTILTFEYLEKKTGRTSTSTAQGIITGLSLLGGGALIRFGVFADGITQDMDTIGTVFAVLVGAAILLMPLFVWWYYQGSTPIKK